MEEGYAYMQCIYRLLYGERYNSTKNNNTFNSIILKTSITNILEEYVWNKCENILW